MDTETLLTAMAHVIEQTEDDPEARQAALEYLAEHAEDSMDAGGTRSVPPTEEEEQ